MKLVKFIIVLAFLVGAICLVTQSKPEAQKATVKTSSPSAMAAHQDQGNKNGKVVLQITTNPVLAPVAPVTEPRPVSTKHLVPVQSQPQK